MTAPSFSVVHGRMVRDEPRPAPCRECGGVKAAPASTAPASMEPVFYGFGRPAPCVCARPAVPPPAEFVRFLVEHGNPAEAMHGIRDLLHHYAATWAVHEGVPPAKAQREAMALLNEATATADEMQREAL